MTLLYKWNYEGYSMFIYKMADSDMFSLLFFGKDITIQNLKFRPRPSWCDSGGILISTLWFILGHCDCYRALLAKGKIGQSWEEFTKSPEAKMLYDLPLKSKYLTCVQKEISYIA